MLSTIRRGVLMAAAAGITLLGLGLGQASAAVPALPGASLPALPVAAPALPVNANVPTLGAKTPATPGDLSAVKAPGVQNVNVAGIGSDKGASLPKIGLVPNVGGTTVDGVRLPSLGQDSSLPTPDKLLDGSALSSLDAMKTTTDLLPTLGLLQGQLGG